MTRTEHLLVILMEECAEVAQRCSKALRFGLEEVQANQTLTNAERLKKEMIDLVAVWGMLCKSGATEPIAPMDESLIESKQQKVEDYFELSREQGTLGRED